MHTIDPAMESMLEAFVFETESMLEQLDDILLQSERAKSLTLENINDIFRITHTIKGSAAMMSYDGISELAHALEDVFYVLREEPGKLALIYDTLFDLVLSTSDFFKVELEKLQESSEYVEGNPSHLIQRLHEQAKLLSNESPTSFEPEKADSIKSDNTVFQPQSNSYEILIHFEDDCQMEHMRAFMLMTQLQNFCEILNTIPSNPEEDASLAEQINKNGFQLQVVPNDTIDDVLKCIEDSLNIKSYEVFEIELPDLSTIETTTLETHEEVLHSSEHNMDEKVVTSISGAKQSLISVNKTKLDHLMDLVGELVTAESMVIRNPDLKGLKLDNFTKSIRELRKLTDELQDIVMSIRMVPLQSTFKKMDRIVRDMSKKLDKKVELVIEGGDTEIDKTISDAIADPFMHMIRNAVDHGMELPEERIALGKSEIGTISLSARNIGGEIHIEIADDGAGLDAQALLEKARNNGILTKPESEYTDKEAFQLIMLPGFSTNEEVTEYSGRGVGMDVVRKNIEQVGGNITIHSERNVGTTFSVKIPLTLAIVSGMNLSVGNTVFTIPITSITQSFKVADQKQVITNVDGSEMIMLRGECYPIIRLHNVFQIDTNTTEATDGIFIQVESMNSRACIFADELLGEYQVVVKPFPTFFNKYNLKEQGLSGCSILGDGTISLILDTNGLLNLI